MDHVRSSPSHSGSGTQLKRLEEKLANKQRLRQKVQLKQLRHRLTREYGHLKTSVEQWRKAREDGFDTQREAFNKQTGETLARCVCCAVAYGCWIHNVQFLVFKLFIAAQRASL